MEVVVNEMSLLVRTYMIVYNHSYFVWSWNIT